MASENEIAFENACVVTPTNATLVKDLNLRVPAGTNLLVTGPNGSGMVLHHMSFTYLSCVLTPSRRVSK